MQIASWNVNSISARLAHVKRWLGESQVDVLCMQETKSIDEKFPRQAFEELGYDVAIYGEKTYNGVAIASKLPIANVHRGYEVEVAAGSKRLIAAEIGGIKIVNVYIPNGQYVGSEKYCYKLEWMKKLKEFLFQKYSANQDLLICGDFNIAPDDRDVYNPALVSESIMCSSEERGYLDEIRQFGFDDIFRRYHKEGGYFTWWDYRAGCFRRNMGFRIDHIWTTRSLAERSVNCLIDKEIRKLEKPSDHSPVIAEFQ
jgi:exodeoxyribonuclease-3